MSLMDHLEELRTRLFIMVGVWVAATIVAFMFQDPIVGWIREPLSLYPQAELTITKVFEGFIASMQVAAFSGLVLASPILGWQIWAFIAPGLHDNEKRYAVPFVLGGTIMFVLGALFARYLVLPFMLPFMLGFFGDYAKPLIGIGNYFSTMLLYMTIFGLMFEMPIMAYILGQIGIINHQLLAKQRRAAIVAVCILAAAITPSGDPINFALAAGPMLVLYEVSILVLRFSKRRVPISDDHVSP